MGYGVAEQQCENNDLQHLALRHRLHGVRREDIDQHLFQGRRRRGLEDRVGLKGYMCTGTDDHCDKQRYRHRNGRGHEVKEQGFSGNRPHARAVAERTGATDQRDQHQRDYQQLQ